MFQKGGIPWNKGKTGLQTAWNKGKTGVQTYSSPWNKGKTGLQFYSEEHRRKISIAKTGSNNPTWKGGRKITKEGYIYVYRKGHHRACENYVYEHILVYEDHHKCCILPWIHTHHIDRNRQNNNIDNLMLLSPKEHRRIHYNTTPMNT